MSSVPLLRAADADELARRLGVLGPSSLGLLRHAETLLAEVRDDDVYVTRQRSRGTAVEVVTPGARRHLYSPHCSPAALDRLVGIARSDRLPEPNTDNDDLVPQDQRVLPDEVVTTMLRLVRTLTDRMMSRHPALRPMIEADASRVRIAVLRPDCSPAEDDRLHLDLRIGARLAGAPASAHTLRVISGGSLDALCRGDRHLSVVDEVARAAVERAEAVDTPEGEMPVVLAPAGPAALLHEVCGHGLEADIACAPGAAYRGLIGSRVASPLVTVVDDPGAPRSAPLYEVDDEGRRARPTTLIDRGVLTGYLADGESGRRTGHPPTGNGRRLDHTHPALTRMSCTYLAAGQTPPGDVLAGVRRGLYVRAIVTGETDMSGGEFSARVTESYLIENGRITAPVRTARLHGIGARVLREIDAVGDDVEFLPFGFQCNKLSQHPLTVSVGQPTIRVRAMGVGAG